MRLFCNCLNGESKWHEDTCPKAHVKEAQKLISEGWESISNSSHILAKLPPGMSAIDALCRDEPRKDARQWASRLGEDSARGYWERVHARGRKGCYMTVHTSLFLAFRGLGGKCAR